MDIDRYGRTIGMVMSDNINANEALLKAGLAWHYEKYDDNKAWAFLQDKAKQEKKGVWSFGNSIAPWGISKIR